MKKIVFILLCLSVWGSSAVGRPPEKSRPEQRSGLEVVDVTAGEGRTAAGIRFTEGRNWQRIVKQAQKEGKLIFADCYTQSCAPCRMMAEKVFTQAEAGVFFNSNFVNVKYDMEQEGDGKQLQEKFRIGIFPTLLFIDPATQEIVHKIVGSCTAATLLAEGKTALDPQCSLAGMHRRYAAGEREEEFIRAYIRLLATTQSPGLENVVPDYLGRLTAEELATPEHWTLLQQYVHDPLSPPLLRVAERQEVFHAAVGAKAVDYELGYVIRQAVSGLSADFDAQRYAELVRYLQRLDHPVAPGALATLYAAGAIHRQDWPMLAQQLETAVRYNLFRQGEGDGFFTAGLDHLTRQAGEEILRQIVLLPDLLCERTPSYTAKAGYMRQKAAIERRLGDKAGAAASEAREKNYRTEAARNLEF